jgi:hypothetical protein
MSAAVSSSPVTSFFKVVILRTMNVSAKEATFAYHKALHDLSFKTDCSSKPISQLFDVKFSLLGLRQV